MGNYYNALDERYEEIILYGQHVLFNPMRIVYDSLPKGVYRYEVRDDGQGNMCQLAPRIMINHWGTILSNKEIKLDKDGFRDIDENNDIEDVNDGCSTIEEYLERYPVKHRSKEIER